MLSGCCVHRQQPVKTLRLSSGDCDLLSLVTYFSLRHCLCVCRERERVREREREKERESDCERID